MHDVWYGSSTVDSDYCGNYFGSAGTAAEKNSLYNYHCTAVCVWVGPGSLHGTDDAFCGCGAEPAACVTVQNGGNRKYREYCLIFQGETYNEDRGGQTAIILI